MATSVKVCKGYGADKRSIEIDEGGEVTVRNVDDDTVLLDHFYLTVPELMAMVTVRTGKAWAPVSTER